MIHCPGNGSCGMTACPHQPPPCECCGETHRPKREAVVVNPQPPEEPRARIITGRRSSAALALALLAASPLMAGPAAPSRGVVPDSVRRGRRR
jgi:hypothetical protein